MSLKIAVIGLGYVGLPLAIFIKKFKVYGYDENFDRINSLKFMTQIMLKLNLTKFFFS